MKKTIKESLSKPAFYLLSKRNLKMDIEDISPSNFNNGNFLLVKDISEMKKEEILDMYEEKGFKNIISISQETSEELKPYLEIKKVRQGVLTEIEEKTPGFKKYQDEPIVKDIKSFFEKDKSLKLKNIQIIGETLTIDAEFEYESKQENLSFRRVEAKQQVYDIKVKLEKELEKKYNFVPLSIQGIDVQMNKTRFEINSMLMSNTRENVEMFVDNVNKKKIVLEKTTSEIFKPLKIEERLEKLKVDFDKEIKIKDNKYIYTRDINLTEYQILCKFYSNYIVNVVGDVYLENKNLSSIDIKFGKVSGVFDITYNNLISLKNCPEEVGEDFKCSYNNLTSLEHCPKVVGGDFWRSFNSKQFTEEEVEEKCKIGGIVL